MIAKILGRLEEERKMCLKESALISASCIERMKAIVQEVAKEYDNASDNDLAVVSSLPSLYPLQPFEEEAIHKVVVSAKDGGWIPCSERLPQEDEPEKALCEIVNITLKNGAVTVGWCNRFIEKWYVVDEHCDYPIPYKYEDVTAWQPLPTPYQKGE